MLRYIYKWAAVVLVFCAASRIPAETFPKKGWVKQPDALASPEAVKGGVFRFWAGPYPKSFNYYLDQSPASIASFNLMYESLLGANPITRALEPSLAESWTISEDKKVFTFKLDPRARWSDDQLITAEDVEWTFNTARDPKSLTGQIQAQLERFERMEIVDSHTVRFYAREASFLNIYIASGFDILPKHSMQGKEFNRINFEFPVVSGPYRIEELKEGTSLTMLRREEWWRKDNPDVRNLYNFDRLKLVFYSDREDAYAAFRKGIFDYYPVYTSHRWHHQTSGELFEKNWLIKQQVFNHQPLALQGNAMNLQRPLFKDVRVRRAMAHLYDRRRMNKTLMYNAYALHRSYFEDVYDAEHPNPHPVLEFDPKKAGQLLEEAGWKIDPKSGYREKNGQKFSFTFLSRSSSQDKFLAIFNEALEAAGVKMRIDRKDWAAWSRDVDEKNFDMTGAAWGPSYPKNPENLWASKEADRTASPNYAGFKDKEVDALIEKHSVELDLKKRQELLRQIDAVLVEQVPYILGWYSDNVRLLYWNKFGTPATILDKYSNERSAYLYWWYDADRSEELEEAMKNGWMLPEEPGVVRFDEALHPQDAL